MSWIDKEIKRRAKTAAPAAPASAKPPPESEATRMAALWQRFEAANAALPDELRLALQRDPPAPATADGPKFLAWLRAPDGAALGFTGDAIRYAWPVTSARRSNNFWIRWLDGRYLLIQRVGQAFVAPPAEYRLDERRVDRILQCLVMGKRVKPRAMRKRRFGIF